MGGLPNETKIGRYISAWVIQCGSHTVCDENSSRMVCCLVKSIYLEFFLRSRDCWVWLKNCSALSWPERNHTAETMKKWNVFFKNQRRFFYSPTRPWLSALTLALKTFLRFYYYYAKHSWHNHHINIWGYKRCRHLVCIRAYQMHVSQMFVCECIGRGGHNMLGRPVAGISTLRRARDRVSGSIGHWTELYSPVPIRVQK